MSYCAAQSWGQRPQRSRGVWRGNSAGTRTARLPTGRARPFACLTLETRRPEQEVALGLHQRLHMQEWACLPSTGGSDTQGVCPGILTVP